MSTHDINDKLSAEFRQIVHANHGMNWAGLPQSEFIGPRLVNQQLSQSGVVFQSPVHMSDEPRERKALPRRAETHLTEKSERRIRIKSASKEVGVRPCTQVKLAVTMGRSEIDTCGGKSAYLVGPMRRINRVDDLLSRSQAGLYEGKQSAVSFIRGAEEGANMRAGAEQRAAKLRLGTGLTWQIGNRLGHGRCIVSTRDNADSTAHIGTGTACFDRS